MPQEVGYKHEESHGIRRVAHDCIRARRDKFVISENGDLEREIPSEFAVAQVTRPVHAKSKEGGEYAEWWVGYGGRWGVAKANGMK